LDLLFRNNDIDSSQCQHEKIIVFHGAESGRALAGSPRASAGIPLR